MHTYIYVVHVLCMYVVTYKQIHNRYWRTALLRGLRGNSVKSAQTWISVQADIYLDTRYYHHNYSNGYLDVGSIYIQSCQSPTGAKFVTKLQVICNSPSSLTYYNRNYSRVLRGMCKRRDIVISNPLSFVVRTKLLPHRESRAARLMILHHPPSLPLSVDVWHTYPTYLNLCIQRALLPTQREGC